MNKKRWIPILVSLFLMLLGLAIYLLFNRTASVSKQINAVITTPDIQIEDTFVVKMIRGYAADFLWSISFTLVVQAILVLKRQNIWWLLLCSSLGVIFEFMQFLGIANGTADIRDNVTYLIGSAFGIIIILGGKLYEEM